MSRTQRLGRGLDALLGQQDQPAVRSLAVDRLRPNRRQPRSRFDDSDLAELAESIRAQGVVQPIVVTPEEDGAHTIIAGERRWRAARLAGLSTVPVVVRQVSGDRELLELALVENLQRSDLNPLEEAEAYRMLGEEFELSQEQIAARVGKSRPAITNALRLLRLPGEIQDLLRDGRLTAGQARPLLSLERREDQVRVARQAVDEGLSARELERSVRKGAPKPRAKKPQRRVDVHTAAAQEKLTQHLQTPVEIHRRRQGGEVRIRFHTEEELMRIYDLLMEKGRRR